jgi:hypothetical protein
MVLNVQIKLLVGKIAKRKFEIRLTHEIKFDEVNPFGWRSSKLRKKLFTPHTTPTNSKPYSNSEW